VRRGLGRRETVHPVADRPARDRAKSGSRSEVVPTTHPWISTPGRPCKCPPFSDRPPLDVAHYRPPPTLCTAPSGIFRGAYRGPADGARLSTRSTRRQGALRLAGPLALWQATRRTGSAACCGGQPGCSASNASRTAAGMRPLRFTSTPMRAAQARISAAVAAAGEQREPGQPAGTCRIPRIRSAATVLPGTLRAIGRTPPAPAVGSPRT